MITLLVPCHNAARFLPRLIEFVRAQTKPFAKIICYDDGSNDDTVRVTTDMGLQIITGNPNRGVAHARNQLAAAATTEWIHFHDADDWIAPTFVETLALFCQPDYDVVSCDADWIDEHTRQPIISWRYSAAELQARAAVHLLANPLGLNNSIIRQSVWTAIGGCDESLTMWEDADIHYRLARAGARFRHIPQVLTKSLRRPESFSHDYRKSWMCRLQALEGYAQNDLTPDLAATLAAEAEKTAGELAFFNDRVGSERAIALCDRLGRKPPTTTNPVLRGLKSVVPAYHLLRLQARHRHRHAAAP